MTREELEKMEKEALIDLVLKKEEDLNARMTMYKWQIEENNKLRSVIDAVQLVLNNVKR